MFPANRHQRRLGQSSQQTTLGLFCGRKKPFEPSSGGRTSFSNFSRRYLKFSAKSGGQVRVRSKPGGMGDAFNWKMGICKHKLGAGNAAFSQFRQNTLMVQQLKMPFQSPPGDTQSPGYQRCGQIPVTVIPDYVQSLAHQPLRGMAGKSPVIRHRLFRCVTLSIGD